MDLSSHSSFPSRGESPFPALDRARGKDLTSCLDRFERLFDLGEGAGDIGRALDAMSAPGKDGLIAIHRRLFDGRAGAGELRRSAVEAVFPGQDCPAPEFIDRSLSNFEEWLAVDSFTEIHPIQQAALALTRLVDIWPFQFGNRTAGVVFANFFVLRAGHPPFVILPEDALVFDRILEQAIRMQTEPLVRAIYKSIEREVDRVCR